MTVYLNGGWSQQGDAFVTRELIFVELQTERSIIWDALKIKADITQREDRYRVSIPTTSFKNPITADQVDQMLASLNKSNENDQGRPVHAKLIEAAMLPTLPRQADPDEYKARLASHPIDWAAVTAQLGEVKKIEINEYEQKLFAAAPGSWLLRLNGFEGITLSGVTYPFGDFRPAINSYRLDGSQLSLAALAEVVTKKGLLFDRRIV